MVYISSADVDIVELYEKGRERVRKEKEAENKKEKEGQVKEGKKKKKRVALVPEQLESQISVTSDMGLSGLFVCE